MANIGCHVPVSFKLHETPASRTTHIAQVRGVIRASKLLPVILGMVLSCMAAFAQAATLSSLSGTALAIPYVGAPRTLRQGDSLNQGDTIATGADATAVQVVADAQGVELVGDSRLTITKYVYDRADASKSAITLTLSDGGMEAITGAIGKANPGSVKYMVGDAVIGIQGTTVQTAIRGSTLSVICSEGQLIFTVNGRSFSIPAGQGTISDGKGNPVSRPAAEVLATLRAQGTAIALIFAGMTATGTRDAIQVAINQAIKDNNGLGTPKTASGTPTNTGTSGSSGSSGSGGGGASAR